LVLRARQLSTNQLKDFFDKEHCSVSVRQIQRDLNDLTMFLNSDEILSLSKENKIVYYTILKKGGNQKNQPTKSIVLPSRFYTQIISQDIQKNLDVIELAISRSNVLFIHSLKNDETGDNTNFETNSFTFHPVQLIYHRDTYYLGGINPKRGVVQIFGVNQLHRLTASSSIFNMSKSRITFEKEFSKRFGVTKNINQEIYDIKLEMSPVLAGFIKSHFWHHSQKFTKSHTNVVMHLKCGINRELLGWLFQWMYNIRIIEPLELIQYYQRTISEIQKNSQSEKKLMYRNIFDSKDI
jgi:predicted DNA-binding transcriptional regulator YafY